MHWQHHLLLFAAAMLGGAVNAVAGGGTLLTFPSLLWAGQLEIVANATSTVALWPGSLSSFWAYRSELRSGLKEILLLAVPSFLGGVVGAVLLLHTDNATFAALVPYLMLLATLLFMVQEPLARWQRRRVEKVGGDGHGAEEEVRSTEYGVEAANAPSAFRPPPSALTPSTDPLPPPSRWAAVLAFQFLVGVYGGYFVPVSGFSWWPHLPSWALRTSTTSAH